MFPAKLAFVTALSLPIFFNLPVVAEEVTPRNVNPSPTDNCANCPSCLCPPAVPIPGYPLYGPPPPGPPPPSSPGYPYEEVPPPPPRGQGKCPPTKPGQCCQQYPQNPQYPSPPGGYVPYPDDNHAASSSPFLIFLSVMMVMLFSSAVPFF